MVTISENLLSEDVANFLAREGFNIVLIGKDLEKLHVIEQRLKAQFQTLLVKVIEYDFQSIIGLNSLSEVENEIKEIRNEISVYVNTIGTTPSVKDD